MCLEEVFVSGEDLMQGSRWVKVVEWGGNV